MGSLFPAHAGMDLETARPVSARPDCSPHTRGWTVGVWSGKKRYFLFPAHAGMDRLKMEP